MKKFRCWVSRDKEYFTSKICLWLGKPEMAPGGVYDSDGGYLTEDINYQIFRGLAGVTLRRGQKKRLEITVEELK